MPGINANLSQAAFDIWDRIPKKERKSPMGAKGAEGRSAWLSSVIIKNEGWSIRYNELVDSHQELEKLVRTAEATIADLQKRIHE
ncbi:MAG TPA: hypothetical protein EYN18_02135 [Nitrospirales bacterium]|nr:hypothetical protein [Nitrospirales bacterium]